MKRCPANFWGLYKTGEVMFRITASVDEPVIMSTGMSLVWWVCVIATDHLSMFSKPCPLFKDTWVCVTGNNVCGGGKTHLFLKFLKSLRDILLSSKGELSHLLTLMANCICSVPSDDEWYWSKKSTEWFLEGFYCPQSGRMDRRSPFMRSALRDLGLRSAVRNQADPGIRQLRSNLGCHYHMG